MPFYCPSHAVARAESLAQMRSGKEFSPWATYRCPNDFDFETLLQESAAMPPNEAYDDAANPNATTQPLSEDPTTASVNAAATPGAFPASASLPQRAEARGPQSPANQRRKRRREAAKVAQGGHQPSPAVIKKYVKNAPQISVSIDCEDLPTTAGAYTAKTTKSAGVEAIYGKCELVSKHGFTPLAWNGMCAHFFFRSFDQPDLPCPATPCY